MISVAVQHHPARAGLPAALLAALPGAELVADPDPDSPLRSTWRTYRRCLDLTPPTATHRLVVQDDAICCPNLAAALPLLAAARPGRCVVLFVGGNAKRTALDVQRAARAGVPWVELRLEQWLPAVAVLWPAQLARDVVAWADAQNYPAAFNSDDEILGRAVRALDHVPVATAPSLVDHPDDVPSLVGRRARHGLDQGRIAACWIGDCDPLSIDWAG